MKTKFLLAFCLVFSGALFSSCWDVHPPACESVMHRLKQAEGKISQPVCIVLCDFSASMDDRSVHFVLDEAEKIYDAYYNKAFIKFYPITSASILPIFETLITTITDSGKVEQSDATALARCLDSLKATDRHALKAALEKEAANRPNATYILRSLQSAIDAIHIADPDQVNHNTIFILSDMLESGTSRWDYINLETRMNEGVAKLEALPDSAAASIEKNIDIKIGFYTQRGKDREQLQHFWDLAFPQLGYSKQVKLSSELAL